MSIWKKYEKSHDYMQKKGIVSKTNKNWNFYVGKQWEGLETGGEKMPMFNFIKPTVKYKVSTISQHSMVANYSDIEGNPATQAIFDMLNKNFVKNWELGKMDTVSWNVVKNAAIQGESYVYWGDYDLSSQPQIIDNTALLLGNENTTDLQEQPYIIIRERLPLEHVKKIAEENGISKKDIAEIGSDTETSDQIINKEEVDDKVTTILYMEKKDGIVHIARATKNCEFEKLHPISVTQNGEDIGGLRLYPIVSYVWEKIPNSARGISEVEGLIQNQIELNKTLARRSITVKMMAFPRLAYDANLIENPEDLDKVGVAIAVNSGGAQSVNQIISYMNATNISSDAQTLSEDLLNITKDLAGAGDYATGNINPEKASGAAIVAVSDQSQIPLNEQVRYFQQFVEDVASLWFELWVLSNYEGIEVPSDEGTESYDYTALLNLRPTIKIDVSQDNQWTKLSEQQTLDNLLAQQQITLEEWAYLAPDNGNVPKGKLSLVLEKRKQQPMQQFEGEGEEEEEEDEGLEEEMEEMPQMEEM